MLAVRRVSGQVFCRPSTNMSRFLVLCAVLLAVTSAPSAQIDVTVRTDRQTYTPDGIVVVTVTATNTAASPVTMRFPTGGQAFFEVGGARGPFYCSATQMETERTLAPGEMYTWTSSRSAGLPPGRGCYDYILNDNSPNAPPTPRLGPGVYTLGGIVGEGSGSYVRYGQAETTFTVLNPSSSEPTPAGYAVGSAFPNPARSRTWLPVRVPTNQPVRVRVSDMLGREVSTTLVEAKAGDNLVGLEMGKLPSGTYVIHAEAGPLSKSMQVTVIR